MTTGIDSKLDNRFLRQASERDIEIGNFASSANKPPPSKLVVATFNIRYAVGRFLIEGSLLRRFGIKRPARRSRLIERHLHHAARAFTLNRIMPPPDIIALQEADRGTRRAANHNIARELALQLSMNYALTMMDFPRDKPVQPRKWWLDFEEPILADDAGSMGVALLARAPLHSPQRIDLPWAECAWRPRIAIRANVEFGSRRLHIFNSHIDTHAAVENQLAQHRAILDQADELPANDAIVLTGDFNTLTRDSCVQMRSLLESRGYSTPMPTGITTWRSAFVRLHTDWIFTRNLNVTRWGVGHPLGVSDHYPVWIEVAS